MNTPAFLEIGATKVPVTSLEKIMYPQKSYTKADVIDYYIKIAPYILPYLKNRPFSMIPYVNGAEGESFFQKQKPQNAPKWLKSVPVKSSTRTIDYCLINDLRSLIYMANRGCLEMHCWFSRHPALDKPDCAVFDIDPSGETGFPEGKAAALLIKAALDGYGLWSVAKTSGKGGVHVYVPIRPQPYEYVRNFTSAICRAVVDARPDLCTTERTIAKRGDRVYLDAVQLGRGKTLPAPYSLRATPGATVSAPMTWEELGRAACKPESYTMSNILGRIERVGDLFEPVYGMKQEL
ncbi:MAG: non-homologous end-joining DNA ligase [Clostridia bacterium]|nr:non-homologous end-joining DNA ligase [Clostridia bacterium]